jgi:hypothetical protein
LYWRWNAHRLAISAFLILHLSAVGIINLPDSALRQRLSEPVFNYLVPIGLDQAWGMFAPNPVMHPMELEIVTTDKDGILRMFAFPKMTDFSVWRAIPRVRHSKFTSNCGLSERPSHREVAAKYALRRLNVPAASYPIEAEVIFKVHETPPPGQPSRDPMKPPVPQSLQTFRFSSPAEVQQ